jgi:hypothetical protein
MIYFDQEITELLYTNAPYIAQEWQEDGQYVLEEIVRYTTKLYESITGEALNYNTGNNPLETNGKFWLVKAPANSHALLDLYEETITTWEGDGIIEFARDYKNIIAIGNFKASEIKIEYLDEVDGIVEGMTIATSAGLTSIITAGYAYVDSKRFDITDTEKLFTALKDTYVDIDETGTIIYTEVANGATEPTLTSPNQRIAKVVTDADNITDVEDLRTIVDPVLKTVVYDFIAYINMKGYYERLTAPFVEVSNSVVYQELERIGTNVRVTFSRGGSDTYCGYCIAGTAIDAGATLDQVNFATKQMGKRFARVATFSTMVDKQDLMATGIKAETLINVPMLFVVDPSVDSVFNNMVFIAKLINPNATAEVATKNKINWTLEQNIIF